MPSVAVAIAHIADGEFKLMLLMLFRWWWLLLGSSKDSHRIPRVCVCVCVDVLCLVSFHFRFTFSLFALLLPAFIVELYSCRFHFTLFHFFHSVQLAFFPRLWLIFLAGLVSTYIHKYVYECM